MRGMIPFTNEFVILDDLPVIFAALGIRKGDRVL